MKHINAIVFLTAMLCSFASCKKDSTEKIDSGSIAITGSWELENMSGGLAPSKDYPAGNGNTFEFTDSTYKKYTNNILSKSGYYAITPDATVVETVGLVIPAGQFAYRIIFDKDTVSNKIFIDILNGKLRFVSGYFPLDGGSLSIYGRKNATGN